MALAGPMTRSVRPAAPADLPLICALAEYQRTSTGAQPMDDWTVMRIDGLALESLAKLAEIG